ncbi:MAG: hypothetical protein ACTHL8_25155 [Burkholderiaceae bacterium]
MSDWEDMTGPLRGHDTEATTGPALAEMSSTKKLAKCVDVTGKVATTIPGVPPLLSKAIPFITKGFRGESDVVEAAKHVDDSTFSEVPWDVTSFVSNATASLLALSATSEMLFARNLKQTLLPVAQGAVIAYVAENSTMASLFRGVAWGEPFITPFGKAEIRAAMNSELIGRAHSRFVESVMEGKPAAQELVGHYREIIQNVGKTAFFKVPEFPAERAAAALETAAHEVRGLASDAGKVAKLNKAPLVKKLAANVLPGASVVLDGYALHKSWQAYEDAGDTGARPDAMASVLCSTVAMTGSVLNAVGMNTRIAPRLPPTVQGRLVTVGLALMFGGAAGAYALERHVVHKQRTK